MSSSPAGSAAAMSAERVSARPQPDAQVNGASDERLPLRVHAMRPSTAPLCVLFVGARTLLGTLAPSDNVHGLVYEQICAERDGAISEGIGRLDGMHVDVSIVLDPLRYAGEELSLLPGATLGVLTEPPQPEEGAHSAVPLDRLVAFDPALTGERVGGGEVWRSIDAPVSDALFGDVRPLHRAPRAMSLGRSTPHREAILMPVKHHHDLLQVLHGVTGGELAELLAEYDVGIYVPRWPEPGFGQQVALHLAAGQLLLGGPVAPAHGLERDIDYLEMDSSDGLVWTLDRLVRFPEMYQRVRVRGRLKAEQFRASRLFARLAHDLVADVAAFGSDHPASGV
jgi:hypothetical protein